MENDFSMKGLLDSLPPPPPPPVVSDKKRSQLEKETLHLWIQDICLLCYRRGSHIPRQYNRRSALLLPCTHSTICHTCASKLTVCNVCGIPVDCVLKTYRS